MHRPAPSRFTLPPTEAKSIHRSGSAVRVRQRSAFTLLELLLALSLTIMLLTAVYSALELHWRFSTLGQAEVERAQIARAVLTKMSADIRSTMFSASTDAYTEDYDSDDDTDDDTEANSIPLDDPEDLYEDMDPDVTDPADAYAGSSVGVFGDAVSLVLHIRRPYRQVAGADEDVLNPHSQSDQKSVSYFLAGGEGSLASMVAGQFQIKNDYEDGIDGLGRMSGDRFTLALADQQGDLVQLASQTKLIAEEINSLDFEYHDGTEWLKEWDSDLQERVPNAIGVTIGFREPNHPEGSILYHQPSESTDTYRIVVPMVVSQPFEGLIY
jgi:type II secretory pathway pseudopilin PulG